MKTFAVRLLLAALSSCLQVIAVDLTPRYIDSFDEGMASHRLFFADGEKKIGISLDRETQVAGAGGAVVFRFPKFPDASFAMKHSPLTADQPFSGISLGRYREAAGRLLPAGATDVKVSGELENPLTINRWRSYRIAYSFLVGTVPMVQHVTFLDIDPGEQLVLITLSTERNFAEAAARSFQIIRSWQPMLPGDERPVRYN